MTCPGTCLEGEQLGNVLAVNRTAARQQCDADPACVAFVVSTSQDEARLYRWHQQGAVADAVGYIKVSL